MHLDINNSFIELILCARYCSTYEVLSKSLESIVILLFPFTEAEIVTCSLTGQDLHSV